MAKPDLHACDPVKTLVKKNGSMFNVDGDQAGSIRGRELGVDVPGTRQCAGTIVRTHKRAGDLEIVEEAFVSPVAADAGRVKCPFVDRIGWQRDGPRVGTADKGL